MLRAIRAGSQLLERVSALPKEAAAGGPAQTKGMMPKYLVVISRQDLEPDTGEEAEIWLEDNDDGDVEGWKGVAGIFGKKVGLSIIRGQSVCCADIGHQTGYSPDNALLPHLTWQHAKPRSILADGESFQHRPLLSETLISASVIC